MSAGAVEDREGGALLRLKVQPGAARNAVLEATEDYYRVAIAAPPAEGAANQALIRFLADLTGIRRRRITLAAGGHSRMKALSIDGVDAAAVRRALDGAVRARR